MVALAEAAQQPDYPATIALVVSNVADAGGLQIARDMGIEAIAIPHRDFPDRSQFEDTIHEALVRHNIDLVALAGFMRILTPDFVAKWEGRMVNIHPSLLPLYPGLDTHARAITAGDKKAGCTVHLVTAKLDSGPILTQAEVPVLSDDTPDILASRVLVEEHRIYPEALATLARQFSAEE